MEKENGGSFSVDLNENEEGGGGGEGKAGQTPYIALKDRSIALLSGVSGGQEAGKTHVYVTGNGRNVNRDAPVQPPPHDREIMLKLVAARGYFPAQVADRCVVSGGCGDHGSLNGFTESFGQDEPTMVGLGGGRGGEGEGGGLGFAGIRAASCPAVLRGRVSAETGRQMRQHPAGDSGEETPDCDDVTPGKEATGGGAVTRTSIPPSREKHQRNCTCASCPGVNMPNGDVGGHKADITYCNQTGLFSSPLLDQRLGLSDVDSEEVKVANGGLHIVNTTRASCDRSDSGWSTEDNTDIHSDLQARKERGAGCAVCGNDQCDCSGQFVSQCTGEDAPSAAELPPPATSKDPLTPGSSAKLSSPCPSTLSNLNGDSPLSEPNTRYDDDEEEEDFSDLSLPVRPQSLRTNPNIVVSLSCDATPLSPEGDGGFYFGGEGYEEEFRNVLEAGRRQSAPDKLPDLAEQTDGSDSKLMPKRFGIADFFTR